MTTNGNAPRQSGVLTSVRELIDALGKQSDVARSIGVPATTLSHWYHQGVIPLKHWPAFIELAAEKRVYGISSDILMLMHQPKESPAPARAEAAS